MSAPAATLLEQADAVVKTDPKKAESLYKEILDNADDKPSETVQAQSVQESALVKLGELYRDGK
jgi:26S proteasome regulatory subunit N6